jgi:hypothetical protein
LTVTVFSARAKSTTSLSLNSATDFTRRFGAT